MSKKIIFLIGILLLPILNASISQAEEPLYETAKIIKISEKGFGQSSSTYPSSSGGSYRETSKSEQNRRNSEAVGEAISNTFSASKGYFITLQSENRKMMVKYEPTWAWGGGPDLIEGAQAQFRFDPKKKYVFLKRPGEKEIKTEVIFRNLE